MMEDVPSHLKKRVAARVRDLCKGCHVSKITNHSTPTDKPAPATKPLARVFVDGIGPFPRSVDNKRHTLTIVYEHLSHIDTENTENRKDFIPILKQWILNANAKHSPHSVAEMRSDNAPEFRSKEFQTWLKNNGVRPVYGLRYQHHHQAKGERANRTLQDRDRAALWTSGLPPPFWSYARQHVTWVSAHVPSSTSASKPKTKGEPRTHSYERWNNSTHDKSLKQTLACIIPFGEEVTFHLPKETRLKGDNPGELGIYLGRKLGEFGHFVLRSDNTIQSGVRTIVRHPGIFPMAERPEKLDNWSSLRIRLGLTFDPTHQGWNERDPRTSNTESHDSDVEEDFHSTPKFPEGTEIMTTLGPAEIVKNYGCEDIGVRWHKGNDPFSVFTISEEDAWLLADYPDWAYDNSGDRLPQADQRNNVLDQDVGDTQNPDLALDAQTADTDTEEIRPILEPTLCTDVTMPHLEPLPSLNEAEEKDKKEEEHGMFFDDKGIRHSARIRDQPFVNRISAKEGELSSLKNTEKARASVQDLVGKVNADEVELPKRHHQKRGHPLEQLIDDAEHIEFAQLLHTAFGEPVKASTLTHEQRRHVLSLMWVYRAKSDKNGCLSRVKARLTLRGDLDKRDISRMDAYAPVMHMATLRVMLAVGIQDKLCRFKQADVKSAYLTADMKRETWAKFPEGFKNEHNKEFVLPVERALYGGVDSGRCYYDHWISKHAALGFQSIHHDKCYLMLYKDGEYIKMNSHVDDTAYAQKGDALWNWYTTEISKHFELDFQPLTYFLGVSYDIDYEQGIIKMHQAAQIGKMLRALKMADCKAVSTPAPEGGKQPSMADVTPKGECAEVDSFNMYQLLGYLNYLEGATRPDISWALKVLSKFGAKFGPAHIKWGKHIVRYLAGTTHHGITFRRVPANCQNKMQIFTDASHAGDPDTCRSISGFFAKVCGNTVYWKSTFQRIVSHSSTESELMALDKGTTLGQFVRWLMVATGMKPESPIPIFVDNKSTIDIATNPVQPGRNVHVHARYFYVRDLVLEGTFAIYHLRTHSQISDLLVSYKGKPNFLRMRLLATGCAVIVHCDDPTSPWEWDESLL